MGNHWRRVWLAVVHAARRAAWPTRAQEHPDCRIPAWPQRSSKSSVETCKAARSLFLGALKGVSLALALLVGAGRATAQEPTDPWRALAERDVEAAYRLIVEDHPAVVPEANDPDFRSRLETAVREARQRAGQVTSFEGLTATLAGFANALGDKHIRARALLTRPTLEWAGLLTIRRGDAWIVAEEDRQDGEPVLAGARLVSCDGIPAERLAEQRLGGFHAIWSVPAQRIGYAPLLLVDSGNPFLTRPERCVFSLGSEERELTLRWRTARRTDISPRINGLVRSGRAGFGVRQSGAGWWISLQSLSDEAIPVVEAVRRQAESIRSAPYIVLDLRGNGGGNSIYGDQIAEALLETAAMRGEGQVEDCYPVWRISQRNLAELEGIARTAETRMGTDAASFWQRQQERAQSAQAMGQALSGPPTCGGVPTSGQAGTERRMAPASLFAGRLVVLTDHLCFSSCLLVTDRFRQLGALHVGESTDAATRYFEVRENLLPSNVVTFSILQAMSRSSPYQIGPFVPDHVFEGDISSTAELEVWVAGLVAQTR